ncbi:MAG: J domain-containing protein [Ktedonobacteraceae bacterium]
MSVTVILQFANQGWHVRWRTPDRTEFEATKEAFKHILSVRDRYWDPEAFHGKGGWWVAYGVLAEVGHLFANYQPMRDQLEQPHWQQFEQQKKEAHERFAREEELERRRREQETEQQHQKRREQRKKRQPKKAGEERKAPNREEVTLPTTLAEALALLHLTAPVTSRDVKRAYHTLAFRAHPDHGGSPGAMVKINAAYELALTAC